MKKTKLIQLILTVFLCFMLSACGQDPSAQDAVTTPEELEPDADSPAFSVLPGESEAGETAAPDETDQGESGDQEEDPKEVYIQSLLDAMSDAQLAGQMVLCACPTEDAAALVSAVEPAGLILFGKNIDGKTPETLSQELAQYQENSKLPLLIAADEEGGTVARISADLAFRESRFRSPRRILAEDGAAGLIAEMKEKAQLLLSLGVNVNLAPVCDLAQQEGSFMYDRALPGTLEEVCGYIGQMVSAMQEEGLGTVLKHFPGYGENGDTHTASITDTRQQDVFFSADFLPFQAGVAAGSRGVLVSHNIVTAFDAQLPASLSKTVVDVLRLNLGQDLVAMTDDLQMDAVSGQWTLAQAAVMAAEAGMDLILCSDGATAAAALTEAITDGRIPRGQAEESVRRVLLWKIDLGLLSVE